MEKEKLCLRCMRKIGNNTSCPYCSNEKNAPQEDPHLPLKTVVGGRYLIGKVVSANGEGFTYNAFDLELKKPVSLREFFPKGLISRGEDNYCLVNVGKVTEFIDAKDSFAKLWDKLASLRGYTALTPAFDIFEDLGTVYTVTEFLGEGKTLREYLLEKEQGYISWDEARVLFMPVISALGELHASGIVHGAISPSNLVIDANGKIRITGYSIPEIRTEKTSMESEIFEGYAAVEQYGMSGGISPATDIYGFAAVLYRALIGSTPIGAASRLANDKLMIPGKFAEQLPAYVINALVNALQILPEDRTQSFEELRDEMSASPTAQALSSNYDLNEDVSDEPLPLLDDEEDYEYEEAYDSQKPDKKKNVVKIALISAAVSLAVLLLVVLGIKLVSGDNNSDVPTTEESTTGEYQDDYQESKSLKLPDFTGKVYEDVKNDKEYDGLLVFEMETVDSELERGTIIFQSINPGTLIMEERHIVLKVSNGLSVPADNLLLGKDVDDVISELKSIGFKNVRKESTKKATAAYLSNQVFSVVYENSETGKWAELPSDRRLSSGDTIIVYYYSKYEEPTTEPESTEQETIPVEPETDDMTVAEGQDTEEVYE